MLHKNVNKTKKELNIDEIINDLKNIEKIASKENISKKDYDKLKIIIINCIKWGYKEIKNNDCEISWQIFELLDYFNNKLDYEKIFNDYNLSLIININIATCFQINWNLENNLKYLINSHNCLEKIIEFEKSKNDFQNYLNQMKYMFLNSKICLQIAAVCSQLQKNDEAYDWDFKGFQILKKILKFIKILVNLKNLKKIKIPFEINKNQLDHFIEWVNNNNSISNNFKNLYENIKILKNKLIDNYDYDFLYNNKDYLKKDTSKINLDWVEYFSISNIMHWEPISFDKINQEFYFEDFLNEDFWAIITLILSCCLFSMATERRFILINKFKSKNIFKHLKEEENFSFKFHDNSDFIKSKFFHNSSIQILENSFKNNELLTHIKNSFKKNYKYDFLEVINEEENESYISVTTKNREYEFCDKNNTLNQNKLEEQLLSKSENKLNYLKESIENIKEIFQEKKNVKKKKKVTKFKKIKNLKSEKKKKISNPKFSKSKTKINLKPKIYNFEKKRLKKIIVLNKDNLSSKNSSRSNKKSKKSLRLLTKNKKKPILKQVNDNFKHFLSYNKLKNKKTYDYFDIKKFKIKKDDIINYKKEKSVKNRSNKKKCNKINFININNKVINNSIKGINFKSFNNNNQQNISNFTNKELSIRNYNISNININKKIINTDRKYKNKDKSKNLNKLFKKVCNTKNIFKKKLSPYKKIFK